MHSECLHMQLVAMKTQMKSTLLAAFVAVCGAIISQPRLCTYPDICAPRIITNCPNKNSSQYDACPTCCCDSTENVEFYDPRSPEPRCTAPPAVYTMTFVSTWSGACHPDYYPLTAHWSPPTGSSHNTDYQMWDACMDNVTQGVALVSQTGGTAVIENEYLEAGETILDTLKADVIFGVGNTSRDLKVDREHQWVSVIAMLAPSPDRMIGVSNLRLCGGHDWKDYIKVCAELFSTATKSERVHGPMSRNSIQWNNCSFGYFEFTFKEYNDSAQEPEVECEFETHGVCPPSQYIPEQCRTCCCLSSDSVEFYHPNGPNTVCTSSESASYKVSLKSTYSQTCQPFLNASVGISADPDDSYFSGLLMISHDENIMTFDKCMNSINDDLLLYLTDPVHQYLNTFYKLRRGYRHGYIRDFFMARKVLGRRWRRRRSGYIRVSPDMPYLTAVSLLLPSSDTFVGVSGLNLCGQSGWKERFEVCVELLAAVNKTENPDTETFLQDDFCSFGTLVFELKSTSPFPPPGKKKREVDIGILEKRAYAYPYTYAAVANLPSDSCCDHEYIIDGRVIRTYQRPSDPSYSHTLLVRVVAVYYDDLDHIEVGDVLRIKISALLDRIGWDNVYRLAGTRECGTNELEISERGAFVITQLSSDPCQSYILGGGCDDPR